MRILFSKGDQRKFIDKILCCISAKEAASVCGLSERTIRDWRREKFLPDKNAVEKLCEKTKIPFPANVKLRDDYWYVESGSVLGAIAVLKKYGKIGGNPEYRKRKWFEWWNREGKFKCKIISPVLPIRKPRYSKELAEFVGIILGDGSIYKNQITLTLHYKDDKDFGDFAEDLVKKLFDVPVKKVCYEKYSINRYFISRKGLVDFCVNKLGLKIGNKIKQQVDIPEWIKSNISYSIACVRGLFDTDGCVFNHHYMVNGKFYDYTKLCFTSYSAPLRKSVFDIMSKAGLSPRISQEVDIRIDSIENVKKYFKIVKSHNPKHLNKYKK